MKAGYLPPCEGLMKTSAFFQTAMTTLMHIPDQASEVRKRICIMPAVDRGCPKIPRNRNHPSHAPACTRLQFIAGPYALAFTVREVQD